MVFQFSTLVQLHPLKESDSEYGPSPLIFLNISSSPKAWGSHYRIFPIHPSPTHRLSKAKVIFLTTTCLNERKGMTFDQKDPITTEIPCVSDKYKEPLHLFILLHPCYSHLRFCLWSILKGENSGAGLIGWSDSC